MCSKITREYPDAITRNEDVKDMYKKGYYLSRLWGEDILYATFTKQEEA